MKTRQLGTTTIQVTPILLGTWQAGKRGWVGKEIIAGLTNSFRVRITNGLSKPWPTCAIAEQNQMSLSQLALAWLIAQPQTCAIAGARHPDQAIENAHAGQQSLSKDDLAEIEQISRIVTDHLDQNPVLWTG